MAVSTLLYRSETWLGRTRNVSKIQIMEMKFLISMKVCIRWEN